MHQAIIILSEDQRMLAETMARETDADILSVKDVEKAGNTTRLLYLLPRWASVYVR